MLFALKGVQFILLFVSWYLTIKCRNGEECKNCESKMCIILHMFFFSFSKCCLRRHRCHFLTFFFWRIPLRLYNSQTGVYIRQIEKKKKKDFNTHTHKHRCKRNNRNDKKKICLEIDNKLNKCSSRMQNGLDIVRNPWMHSLSFIHCTLNVLFFRL